MEQEMGASPFWMAFYSGLAAPAAIYAPNPSYAVYAQAPSPAVAFAMIAADLGFAATPAVTYIVDERTTG